MSTPHSCAPEIAPWPARGRRGGCEKRLIAMTGVRWSRVDAASVTRRGSKINDPGHEMQQHDRLGGVEGLHARIKASFRHSVHDAWTPLEPVHESVTADCGCSECHFVMGFPYVVPGRSVRVGPTIPGRSFPRVRRCFCSSLPSALKLSPLSHALGTCLPRAKAVSCAHRGDRQACR